MSWQQTVRIALCLIALFAAACGDPEPGAVREGPDNIARGDMDDLPPLTGTVVVHEFEPSRSSLVEGPFCLLSRSVA